MVQPQDKIRQDQRTSSFLWVLGFLTSAFFLTLSIVDAFTQQSIFTGPSGHFGGPDFCTLAISLVGVALAFRQIKPQVRMFFHKLVDAVHAASVGALWIASAATVLGILAGVIDDLDSFMLAPIGNKPDHTYTGWGSHWVVYLVIGVACFILVQIMGKLKDDVALATAKTEESAQV